MRLFVGEETDGKTCPEYRKFQSNSTIEKVVRLLSRKIRHYFFFFFPFSTISPAFCSFSSIRKETKTFSRILVLFFCDVSVMYERFTMRAP